MNDRDTVVVGLVLLLLWWLRPKPQIDTSVSFIDDNGVTWYLQAAYAGHGSTGGNIWTDGSGNWLNSDTGERWQA